VAVEATGNWYWVVDEIEEAGLVPRLTTTRSLSLERRYSTFRNQFSRLSRALEPLFRLVRRVFRNVWHGVILFGELADASLGTGQPIFLHSSQRKSTTRRAAPKRWAGLKNRLGSGIIGDGYEPRKVTVRGT